MVLGMPMTLIGYAPGRGLCGDRRGPLEGAVPADGEEDADSQLHQVINHLRRLLGAP